MNNAFTIIIFFVLGFTSSQNLFEHIGAAIGSIFGGESKTCTDINSRPCIFPFKYDGQEFHQCTSHKSVNGKSWCATSVDDGGQAQCHRKGNCEDCASNCNMNKELPKTVCKKLRVRKNVKLLTAEEKQKLQSALINVIGSKSKWANFQDIASFHGYGDGLSCGDTASRLPCSARPCPTKAWGCCPHDVSKPTPDFLPWHRLYMVQLEELMEPWLNDTNIGLPYWDWSEDWAQVPGIWEGIKSPIKHSSLFSEYWNTTGCKGTDQAVAQRAIMMDTDLINSGLKQDVARALRESSFSKFSEAIDGPHGNIHTGLRCTMSPQMTSAFDPVFWLHHSYVDKLFSQWQKRNRRPKLSTSKYLDPFGDADVNKFDLTFKTTAQTLEYKENLCYCYDDDCYPRNQGNSFAAPAASAQDSPTNQGRPKDYLEAQINLNFDASVAVVVPKLSGGNKLTFRVCKELGEGSSCDEQGSIGLFGPPGKLKPDINVSKEQFKIKKKLFKPSWNFSEPLGIISYWSKIKLSEGNDLIPTTTPPFFIYRFLEDIPDVAHLQKGAQKEHYGDLLNDFDVKNFCDTYKIDYVDENDKPAQMKWTLGHHSDC